MFSSRASANRTEEVKRQTSWCCLANLSIASGLPCEGWGGRWSQAHQAVETQFYNWEAKKGILPTLFDSGNNPGMPNSRWMRGLSEAMLGIPNLLASWNLSAMWGHRKQRMRTYNVPIYLQVCIYIYPIKVQKTSVLETLSYILQRIIGQFKRQANRSCQETASQACQRHHYHFWYQGIWLLSWLAHFPMKRPLRVGHYTTHCENYSAYPVP